MRFIKNSRTDFLSKKFDGKECLYDAEYLCVVLHAHTHTNSHTFPLCAVVPSVKVLDQKKKKLFIATVSATRKAFSIQTLWRNLTLY